MVAVHLPRSLVTLFSEPPPRHLEMDAHSLGELVEQLDRRWPGMRDRLCVDGPALRDHINVFVDGERQIELETALGPTAVVHVIPAIAGG